MTRSTLATLCVLGLLLAGCGNDGPGAADTAARTTATPEPTPSATATPRAAAADDAGGAPVRTSGSRPAVRVLASGLEVPWDIAFLPDGRALLTERPGRVRLLSAEGRLRPEPVARVKTQARGEGGLLGIAVDPDFAEGKRFVYLYVTTASGMEVQRWRLRGNRLRRDGVVLDGIEAGPIHDSGRLRFGPDERLYVATGDAGRRQLSQDRSSLNGKILRLTKKQYRGRARRPEIHALGLRNPQGLAWQPGSKRLLATDHGPSGFDGPGGDDEVNVIRRKGNYGWPVVRGDDHGRFRGPAQLWQKTVAPSGAAFLSSKGSAWTGDLFVAALKGQALHRLSFDGTRVTRDETLFSERYGRLRAVVEAPDGTLWVTTSNRDTYGEPVSRADDRLLQVIPPGD